LDRGTGLVNTTLDNWATKHATLRLFGLDSLPSVSERYEGVFSGTIKNLVDQASRFARGDPSHSGILRERKDL
jgi:hypothetical protein